jgi:hypothetical protein
MAGAPEAPSMAGMGNDSPTAGETTTAGGQSGAANVAADAGAAGEVGTPHAAARNYEVTGTWPKQPVAFPIKPGQLKYTKVVIHTQFLAESCAIGDYNEDGAPDVSSGRIWYEGPDFKTSHPFRDGHGALPRDGAGPELNTGVSDDVADYPIDVNRDGHVDIINIAQCDVPEANDPNGINPGTPNKIGVVQPHASAYWYENPGPAGQAGDPKWTAHLIHNDVRHEQHGLVDMDGDGYPEIFGACRTCMPNETKGFYSGDPKFPTASWFYHPVSGHVTFPYGGLGKMHGEGAGDLNGDGLPDLLSREGAWLQQPGGYFNQVECTGKNIPEGCGFIKHDFYDGLQDSTGNKGGSHMYAVDMDQDGIADVVSADWAHGERLAWYKQGKDGSFTKYYFMGTAAEQAQFGVYFTEPHALQVVDMDGDGRPDVITGKYRFSQPLNCNDPDPNGTPYIYVFKNVATPDAYTGSPITLKPVRVDPLGTPGTLGTPEGGMGIGAQIAIGHVNTDGILDICVATKVGLAVFLGQ